MQITTNSPWRPTSKIIHQANITRFMNELNIKQVDVLHEWTVKHYTVFWQRVIDTLDIKFTKQPTTICDLSLGVESPNWFPDAELNIVESCFNAPPNSTALWYRNENGELTSFSYKELNKLTNQLANGLVEHGLLAGDAIAICMPMTPYAVAIYLAVIKIGAVIVSIADSFSSHEIATRLKIARAKAIFTQDFSFWNGKKIPLYNKITPIKKTETTLKIIIVPCETDHKTTIHSEDYYFDDFLSSNPHFNSVPQQPMTAANILFSSGTTGEPKAIVWNHTTPIKAASDAYFHQDIHPGDILAWPTNLGWMMGPWLIFAALINQASIALYPESPKDRAFGQFIQDAKVTMLGVVPTLVATWRQSRCMENLDWHYIKVFSSTGECSNPDDMQYLMSLAGGKPIIEYCGGTEIGGAYLSSTVLQDNYPSLFSTPTMGMGIVILDENNQVGNIGEVAIIPPSIGLSTQLINADNYQVYFANMPKLADGTPLRRHGDEICRLENNYYAILGRSDDTMNLGGIKISAAEIERALAGIPDIVEVAAIAITPTTHGPSQLIIYASTNKKLDKNVIIKEMQSRINHQLNPLFKIHEVILINELPKTASNKIMRRVLRNQYSQQIGK